MTHAISTALGSAPIPCAMERQIGTISAVVAVFDMKFVMIQQRINTTNVSTYGDGFVTKCANHVFRDHVHLLLSPDSAAARDKRTAKQERWSLRSMDFSASFSEITPVRIRSQCSDSHPEIHNLMPIFCLRRSWPAGSAPGSSGITTVSISVHHSKSFGLYQKLRHPVTIMIRKKPVTDCCIEKNSCRSGLAYLRWHTRKNPKLQFDLLQCTLGDQVTRRSDQG